MNLNNKWLLTSLGIIVLSVAGLYLSGVFDKKDATLLTQDIAEIDEILETEKNRKSKAYDLEETIRIVHGLDIARKESENFEELFQYMKEQDYSNVAPDIIEAKSKLLPILNELRLAEAELENAEDLYKMYAALTEIVLSEGVDAAIKIESGIGAPAIAKDIIDVCRESFNTVMEYKEGQDDAKEVINKVKAEYMEYLNDFVPVYLKYMYQWDRLCLKRDNAYLEIHQGNVDAAFISLNQVLEMNPTDKEGQILKALCLILKQQKVREKDSCEVSLDYASEAKDILENYIDQYPSRSAPASLLLGTYYSMTGDINRAINAYDQSAKEYPRQSEALLDMLNSYKQRSYLRKTAEGIYILQLYKSTMEGYGFFSPNFQKATLAFNNNQFEEAKEEILRHFFRRGNQGVYDYLISDMVHCETYLPESFNLIFKEKSFLDLEATAYSWSLGQASDVVTEYIGKDIYSMYDYAGYETLSKNNQKLNIKIRNRSDIKLSNVRLFLCLHLTDMYKDDYEVFKVKTTINNIEPNTVADFGTAELNFSLFGKDKNVEDDIVTARAIIISDNIISWVDAQDFKLSNVKRSYNHYYKNASSVDELNVYFGSFGMDWSEIFKLMQDKSSIEVSSSYLGKDEIYVKLPRVLAHLNPVFSINQIDTDKAEFPASVKLNGPTIDIKFKYDVVKNGKFEFYLSSDKAKVRWDIFLDENKKVQDVSTYLM